MTETTEFNPQPPTPSAQPPDNGSNRLGQVLAWVGIIAGIVFVIAVIFFSGFLAGRWSGDHFREHGGYHDSEMWQGGQQMWPGGMMGPGSMMGPGVMPGPGGQMGPGRQFPTTSAPTSPTP